VSWKDDQMKIRKVLLVVESFETEEKVSGRLNVVIRIYCHPARMNGSRHHDSLDFQCT
jgi:hypothetical protein